MFRKLALAFALSIFAGSAFAACTNPLVIKDGSAANISMSMTSNADGFCQYNFNMAQINGVAPLMGNGATGTGSPRVTIANDNTVPTGWPTAANQTGGGQKTQVVDGSGNVQPSGDTVARAIFEKITDGTNTAAVKAANTVATTDVGLVVAVANTLAPGQAAAASSSPVAIAKNSGTGSTIAGAAVGTAGSASTEVVTVQGIASGTPMPVSAPATGLPSTPGTLAGGATFVSGTTAAMTGTTSTSLIPLVSSNRIYVTRVKCNNSSGTATLVQIRDGSAGTVLDTLAAGATYGGEQGTGSTPLFWTTAGTALFAQNVTTGASVICTASGYSG